MAAETQHATPSLEAGEAIHGAETTPHATTEAEGHGGGGGLPQFRFEQWGGQIVWLLLIFMVLYILLGRVFTPRLRKIIDERAQTISDAVEQARLVQTEAAEQARVAEAEVAEARARSQRVGLDARAAAAAEAAKRQAAEEAKLAEKIEEAETRIRAARDAAMTNVGTIASDTAAAIVEKLTGQAASKSDIEAALTAARQGAR
jgi:F-type H+-transporting ATPase subunit b